MTHESLAELAQLTATRRPLTDLRAVGGRKNRAALFVGSGVFAAAAAAVLTFFMLNANNSIGRASLPLVASIERSAAQKNFPWQPSATQQPISTGAATTFVRNETVAPAQGDLDVEAEAQSDASEIEPGHPGPPPPNTPPGPSEPPSLDANGVAPEDE